MPGMSSPCPNHCDPITCVHRAEYTPLSDRVQTPSSYRNHTQQLQEEKKWSASEIISTVQKSPTFKDHIHTLTRTLSLAHNLSYRHTHTHNGNILSVLRTALQPMQVLRFCAKAMRPPTLEVRTVLQRVWSPSETNTHVILTTCLDFPYTDHFEPNECRCRSHSSTHWVIHSQPWFLPV